MRLIHYSREPVHAVHCVQQQPDFKPVGFWFSVEGEDDWKSWCEGEQFRLDHFSCETEVLLHPLATILHLCSAVEIRLFNAQYGLPVTDKGWLNRISWDKVALEYQGVIIAPYQWVCRNELMWYYGWDCASGCVWDAAAVQELRRIKCSTATPL